jgi:hypothetical protein
MADELYFDKNPARCVRYMWDRCLEWWRSIEDRVQEEYDMSLGYDAWMAQKADMGFSDLTVPLIYVMAEARKATMLELLLRQEPFFRVDPLDEYSSLARVAAERKESALQNMRRDLDWDSSILDLFDACEFSSHAWVSLEQEELQIGPQHGLLATSDLYGTKKLFNTFRVYSPGQVIIDGFQQRESALPSKFKLSWMPYHELKQRFPERVGDWITKYARTKDDSAYYNPNEAKARNDKSSSITTLWQGGGGGSDSDSGKGFLVAEGHLWVTMSEQPDERVRVIYHFLPEVTHGPNETESSQYGYRLSVDALGSPFPFDSVSSMVYVARGRSLPYTIEGMSTARLLLPLQREFSDELATERDLDRQYLQPQMAFDQRFLVGKEQPQEPGQHWVFNNRGNPNFNIRDAIVPLHTTTPNRAYLTNTRQEVRALMELIAAASEATTGGRTDPNEKVGIFQQRSAGGATRINLTFFHHAQTLLRAAGSIMSIMAEAEDQYLNPGIRADSKTFGRATALSRADILTPSQMGIPALSQYSTREAEKVMWLTVGEVINNMMDDMGMEVKVMLVEDILRSQTRNEMRVQQYKQAASAGITAALQMQAAQALAPQLGGPTGDGGGPQASPMLARKQSKQNIGA